jgi:hypothetical protein
MLRHLNSWGKIVFVQPMPIDGNMKMHKNVATSQTHLCDIMIFM